MISPVTNEDLSRLRQLNRLLERALSIDEAERDVWIENLLSHDRQLASSLREMLRKQTAVETDSFLAKPVVAENFVREIADSTDEPDCSGDTVGPYRLVRQVGHGGMGSVWLAERADGSLERQVALKLPHRSWAPGIRQRMVREVKLLALLEHNHIARLYDAGSTSEGRPYLALEYVDGEPIDKYCESRALSHKERVRLFLQALSAVSYAHAQLIVHRDLKPNNILVSKDGQVRLLDFGIAKLIEHDSQDGVLPPSGARSPSTRLTRVAGIAMTLDYASPEQIAGDTLSVASDVYSLGVVLFELITGKRPYSLKRTSNAALEEAILERDVPLASSVTPRNISKHIKGDLDIIISKALKKSVQHRYSSVEAFANDLTRYLDGHPVLAQKDSYRYRAAKFLGRNVIAVSLASLAFVAIGGIAGLALWQARLAKLEATRATAARNFAISIFNDVTPFASAGNMVSAADLLNAASPKLLSTFSDDPCGRAELALSIARGIERFGRVDSIEQPARIAEEAALGCDVNPLLVWQARLLLSESLIDRDPAKSLELATSIVDNVRVSDEVTALLVIEALDNRSFLVAKQNDKSAAIQALLQARQITEQFLGMNHDKMIRIVGFLANTYRRFGDTASEHKFARESYSLALAKYDLHRPARMLINAERWYGESLVGQDRPHDALAFLQRALTDQQAIDRTPTIRLANAKFALGRALRQAGRPLEAIAFLNEALDTEYQLRPSGFEDKVNFAISLTNAYLDLARLEDARLVLDRVAPYIPSEPSAPNAALLQLAATRARYHLLNGDSVAASAELQAIEAHAALPPSQQAQARTLRLQVNKLDNDLDSLAKNIERYTASEVLSQINTKGARAVAAAEFALSYVELGRYEEARVSADMCVALLREAQLEISSILATPCMLAQTRIALHDANPSKALEWLRPAFSTWQAAQLQNPTYFEVMYWFAQATLRNGDIAAGKSMLVRARKGLQRTRVPALLKLSR